MHKPDQEVTQLLTARELAEQLQIPVKTLYRWRATGSGPPSLRAGRHLRYQSDDVHAWLVARLTEVPQGRPAGHDDRARLANSVIAALVADAPPLSEWQRSQLAALVGGVLP